MLAKERYDMGTAEMCLFLIPPLLGLSHPTRRTDIWADH